MAEEQAPYRYQEFPRMVYKGREWPDSETRIVSDDADLGAALAAGWSESVPVAAVADAAPEPFVAVADAPASNDSAPADGGDAGDQGKPKRTGPKKG